VREVKRRVRVVASSYGGIDRSVTRWIVVTMVEWSSEVRWELVPKTRCSSKDGVWQTVPERLSLARVYSESFSGINSVQLRLCS